MNQYKITCQVYNEMGALTSAKMYFYKDTPEQARCLYEKYNGMTQEVTDPETGEVKRFKAYKVSLSVTAYKLVEDPAAFFAQFEI